MINRIQKTRKDIQLNVSDRVSIQYYCDDKLKEVIETYIEHIKSETLTIEFNFSTSPSSQWHVHEIEQSELKLKLREAIKTFILIAAFCPLVNRLIRPMRSVIRLNDLQELIKL